MGSTHSSVLIDVSKPHTTIVRIANDGEGRGRTFATDKTLFTPDEKQQLQMVRACHPTVNEFFFADHVFLVEGETEHAVLSVLLSRHPSEDHSSYHIVNCMGKGNLPMIARILNQFGAPYTVIHDSDSVGCKNSVLKEQYYKIIGEI
jgi:putative ATP-dependent endonuclease of OLD family